MDVVVIRRVGGLEDHVPDTVVTPAVIRRVGGLEAATTAADGAVLLSAV